MPEPAAARPTSNALAGIAWMSLANVLFAVMTICARVASESASWSTVACTRAGVGALCALAIALPRGAQLRSNHPRLSWARSLLGTCAMICTFYAFSAPELPVGDAVTIFATAPLLIALLSPRLLGEAPGRGLWGLLLVAFAGVALVAGPHLSLGGHAAWVACGAAVFSAFAMIFLRKMRSPASGKADSPESITLHFSLTSFVILGAIAIPTYQAPTGRDTALLLAAGLAGGLAQLAMTRAYALTEAARLGAVSYLGTILGFLGGVVFLGERPASTQLAGSLLVIGAGMALAWLASRPAAGAAGGGPVEEGAAAPVR